MHGNEASLAVADIHNTPKKRETKLCTAKALLCRWDWSSSEQSRIDGVPQKGVLHMVLVTGDGDSIITGKRTREIKRS